MCYDKEAYIVWCFGALILIVYAIAIISAIVSWKRSKFSGWLFVPIILLIVCPPFIFPVYSHAEYAARRRKGDGACYTARLKYLISWLPVIAAFLSSWLFSAMEYFAPDAASDDGPVISTLAYVVALLFSVAILGRGGRLDKLKIAK
jgi:uncharacterized membrane protein YhaH (DUF805 family)